MTFVFDGITTKIIIGNIGKNHVRNNTYLSTSQASVTVVFWMTSPLFLLIKLDSKDPNKQEHHWRYTLKTMAPQWLNVEDH